MRRAHSSTARSPVARRGGADRTRLPWGSSGGSGSSACAAASQETAGSLCKGSRVSTPSRDLADVPASEVVASVAVHLMSAAAVKCGLSSPEEIDLDEARKLITALAGLVTAARPDLGVHAAPLRDGLRSLQKAFREASPVQDEPGEGPGEKLTGPVW